MAEDLRIQHKTFVNWCNEYLQREGRSVRDLTVDFGQGSLNLIVLLEQLSGKRVGNYNKAPQTNQDHQQNLGLALAFMAEREQIPMVLPSVDDIISGQREPILGMVWALIMFYDIQHFHKRPRKDRVNPIPARDVLLEWCNGQLMSRVNNFESDWRSGRNLYNLVFAFEPGALPRQPSSSDPRAIAAMALEAAAQRLHVPTVITADDITSPNIDALSVMTYLAGFRKAVTTMDDLERPTNPGASSLNASAQQANNVIPAEGSLPQRQRPQQQQPRAVPQGGQRPPSLPMRTIPTQHASFRQTRPSQRQYEEPGRGFSSHQYESMVSQRRSMAGAQNNHRFVNPHYASSSLYTNQTNMVSGGFAPTGRGFSGGENGVSQYSISLPGWNGDFVAPSSGGPSARTYPVNLLERSESSRAGRRGPMWLQATMDDIALLDQRNAQVLVTWPLNHIRRYGKDINVFSIEIGSLNRNAGIFFFETPFCDDLFDVVKSYVNAW
jgi:hypothetical protein